MDVWEVPQSSRSGLDRGFLMDVGPMRMTWLSVCRLGRRPQQRGSSVRSFGSAISASNDALTDQ